MASQWDGWRTELRSPTPEDRRLDRAPSSGYWRIEGARTKHDEPLVIWREDGQDAFIFQFGSNQPKNTEQHAETWEKFTAGRWLSAIAVPKADWDIALETGRWPDNKPSRPMSDDQRLDIDTGSGDNAAPIEESLGDQISALASSIEKQGEPKDQAAADKLAGDLDRMRALLNKAEAERKAEKAPVIQQGKDIDAKWSNIAGPGDVAYASGEAHKKSFLRKEGERLRKLAEEENARRREEAEAEAERIKQAEIERLSKEAADRAAEAEEGEEAPDVPTTEEIEARAAEVAAASVAPVQEVEASRAVAGSAFGTKRGLKKVKKGVITDYAAFVLSDPIKNHGDMLETVQALANRAAKSGIAITGMRIEEVEE